MRPDGTLPSRVIDLNRRYAHHSAADVLRHALTDPQVGRTALVSSFGAESVVLLHMVAVANPATPILFLDTEMLFPETLDYQQSVAERLGLTDVRIIRPDPEEAAVRDPEGLLHRTDTDACCALRKTAPLHEALKGFDAWITGRKRYQGGRRTDLEFFEAELGVRIKINPLTHWAPGDVQEYMLNNRLPRHPLVAQGYPSIGCAPCTSKVAKGEDPRAGRWRGSEKEECGIHFVNGKVVRGPLPAPVEEPQKEDIMATEDTVIVTDTGFEPDDWAHGFATPDTLPATAGAALAVDLSPDADLSALNGRLESIDMIRIDFPSFSDGRGFTLARRLRLKGFHGRLRAKGHVIADQYAMARRSGFDEVEIPAELARRQTEDQWLARANWKAHDYQARLRA